MMRSFRVTVGLVVLMFASLTVAQRSLLPQLDAGSGGTGSGPHGMVVQRAVYRGLAFSGTFNLHTSVVSLPPAARTEWHLNTNVEVLLVTRGEVMVLLRPGKRERLRAGQRMVVPQGALCALLNQLDREATVLVTVLVPMNQAPSALLK